jgi:hypothetical protein
MRRFHISPFFLPNPSFLQPEHLLLNDSRAIPAFKWRPSCGMPAQGCHDKPAMPPTLAPPLFAILPGKFANRIAG